MEKSAAAKYFEENHYVKITNFIKPEEASFLYDYIKLRILTQIIAHTTALAALEFNK